MAYTANLCIGTNGTAFFGYNSAYGSTVWNNPAYAFDNIVSTLAQGTGHPESWIGFHFNASRKIVRVTIQNSPEGAPAIYSGAIRYSDDNINWSNATSYTNLNNGMGAITTFDFSDKGSHAYWAFETGSQGYIAEIQMMEVESSGTSVSISAIVSSTTSNLKPPTVSAIRNTSINAVSAISNSQLLNPTVSIITSEPVSITINANIISVSSKANNPSISITTQESTQLINLIENGDCEGLYPSLGGVYSLNNVTADFVSSPVWDGSQSLLLSTNAVSTSSRWYQLGASDSLNGLIPGKQYIFLLKGNLHSSTPTLYPTARFVTVSPSQGTVIAMGNYYGTKGAWKDGYISVAIPSDATAAYLRIYLPSATVSSPVTYVDRLQLYTYKYRLDDATQTDADLCTGGTPIAGGAKFTNPAAAYDTDETNTGVYAESLENHGADYWIGYQFISPQSIKSIRFKPWNANVTFPHVTETQYSDNGIDWIHTQYFLTTNLAYDAHEIMELDTNHGKHLYWRLRSPIWVENFSFKNIEMRAWAEQSVLPIVTIISFSRTRISDESGANTCNVTFTADNDLQAWEARAANASTTPARGVGLLVGSGTTLASGANGTFDVDYTELSQGDQIYTITVYGQSTDGSWSE